MAQSTAERMKEYRQRIKEKGGKALQITIPPELVEVIKMFGAINCPGLDVAEVVKTMVISKCEQAKQQIYQIATLKELEAEDGAIKAYIEFYRTQTEQGSVVTAERFLEVYANSKESAIKTLIDKGEQ